MVHYTSLENSDLQESRGFESHLLRHSGNWGELARIRQPIFGSKSNFLPLFRKAERQKRAFQKFNLLEL